MTHSPESNPGGDGGLNPEQQELWASMRDRSIRMQELMVALAAEMGEMAVDLGRLIDGKDGQAAAGDIPSPVVVANAELFTPFSAAEQALSRPQHQLEIISAKDRELPGKIQEIFGPSLSFFETEVQTRPNPTTDNRVKLITQRNSSGVKRQILPYWHPQAIPSHDEPKKRDKALKRHTHRHRWTPQDNQHRFGYTYVMDYVPLANGTRQLVAYTIGRQKGANGEAFEVDGKASTRAQVTATVAGSLVRRIALIRTEEALDADGQMRSEYTDYDLAAGSIRTQESIPYTEIRKSLHELSYNPEEYQYEGHSKVIGADEVLASLRSYVAAVSGK